MLITKDVLSPAYFFDTSDEAKAHLLQCVQKLGKINDVKNLENKLNRLGFGLLIVTVQDHVKYFESNNEYSEERYQDRQHFIDTIIFDDPE